MYTAKYNVALPKPEYYKRPGSLLLRGDHSNYGRCTLTSNWDQSREGYPKDYDFNVAPVRNLKISSYRHLATHTDGAKTGDTVYNTTYTGDVFKEPDKHGSHEPMVTLDTFSSADMDRDLGLPKRGYRHFLPRHGKDKFKFFDLTTYNDAYTPPYPYTPKPEKLPELRDLSKAYKKTTSQFTDPGGPGRVGKNTWHDESGFYYNSHFKRQIYKIHDPIPKDNYIDDGSNAKVTFELPPVVHPNQMTS